MSNVTSIQNDVVLTNIFRSYNPSSYEFIQDDILPIMNVTSETGDLLNTGTLSQDWLRVLSNDIITRESRTPIISSYVGKEDGWRTERHGAQHPVTKEDGKAWNNKDWKAGMNAARRYYTQLLKINRMIAKEKALADVLFNATTFSSYSVTLTGADQFNMASSDPIGVAKDARRSIEKYAHQFPNVCIMPYPVFEALISNVQLKVTNGIAPTGTTEILDLTMAQLKRALNVDKILVPKVKYETAAKGITSSLDRIWGNYMMFAYVNPNPQPMRHERSLGYTFQLTEGTMDWYEVADPRHCQYVRFEEEYDQLLLDLGAAYLIVNPVSTTYFAG